MGSKIVTMLLLLGVALSGSSLFAENGDIDFDGKIHVSGQAKTLSEQFPENQNIMPVFKTKSGMSKKVFKIAENGQEVEVLPEEVDGKGYYIFKPNEYFYETVRCEADGGTWNVCTYYEFYPSYGGHQHAENIPPYTDGNNNPVPSPRCFYNLSVNTDYRVQYITPSFATKIEHRTLGWGDCGGELYHTVDVKIGGLMSLPPAYQDSLHAGVTYYNLINNPPYSDYHPGNHFGRRSTITSLKQIAWDYYFEFSNAPLFPSLSINDMSLAWGGLFDIDANWSPKPNGHNEHRYGNQADMRRVIWNSSGQMIYIPPEQEKELIAIACKLKVQVFQEGEDGKLTDPLVTKEWGNKSKTPHFHLRFPIQTDIAENPPDIPPDLSKCPKFLEELENEKK